MIRRPFFLLVLFVAMLPLVTLSADGHLAPAHQALAGSPVRPIKSATQRNRVAAPDFDHSETSATLGSTPVMFIENVGQFPTGARFQVRGGLGSNIWLGDDAIWVTILEPATEIPDLRDPTDLRDVLSEPQPRQGVNLKLSFVGANPHPRIEPFDRLDTKVSYFLGNDPEQWQTDVPVWGGVRYVDIYPGVDLELTSIDSQIVQHLATRPGGDLSSVRLRVDGAEAVTLDGDNLRFGSAAGDAVWPLPRAEGSSGKSAVQLCGVLTFDVVRPFASVHADRNSTTTSPYSRANNPTDLVYVTFLGGGGFSGYVGDEGHGIAVDESGAAYVTGTSYSSDFPSTPGAFDTIHNGGYDVFAAKLDASGSNLTYATFVGGGVADWGYDIAVDRNGDAYITGQSYSSDFPTTPGAFDPTYNGGGYPDVFVVKLDSSGSALAYATFLGASAGAGGYGIAVDESGAAYVTGWTASSDLPTTSGAFDTTYNGGLYDAFVVKLAPSGSTLAYATFLGGSDYFGDIGQSIAVDESGAAYITGQSQSPDLPTTSGAFDTTHNGVNDAFVVKLDPSGSTVAYATFLGGSSHDWGLGIAVDRNGAAYVTGQTYSSSFPSTPGAFDPIFNGFPLDAYVVKLNPSGSALVYATFLGGTDVDEGLGIAVDGSGAAYVTGGTWSPDFPTTLDAFDTTHNDGTYDTFAVKLNPSGSDLVYATFLGGSGRDRGFGIAVDENGVACVTGRTESSDLPTTPGAFDTTYNGGDSDAFVAKLALESRPSPSPVIAIDNLYVDDAWLGGTVNRVAGDEFRVVAALSNDSSTSATSIITFSLSHKTGSTPWTFVGGYARPYPPDEAVRDPLSVVDLGDGRYSASYTLTGYSRAHLALRFQLSRWAAPQWIHAVVELGVQGQEPPQQHRETAFRIVSGAPALIITNRASLFDRYGSYGYAQVAELLGTLALISDGDANFPNEIEGLIYNVDWHLDDTAPIPEAIDALIKVTAGRSGALYLMIVGGRDVVPFYPVVGGPLSDGPYADTTGDDYRDGQFELAAGRIVGKTPTDMRLALERGLQGPARVSRAVLASRNWCPGHDRVCVNLDGAERTLETFLIEFDTELVESEQWNAGELVSSLNSPFSFFAFGGHSHNDAREMECPAEPACGDTYVSPVDVSNLTTDVDQNRPFVGLCACSMGTMPEGYLNTQASMVGAWLQKGASGVLASTDGVSYGPFCEWPGGEFRIKGGEQWFNDFFDCLGQASYCRETADPTRMMPVGQAWQMASRLRYPVDTKAVLEFVVYGVPWMRPPFTTDHAEFAAMDSPTESGLRSVMETPSAVDSATVVRSLTLEVTGHSVFEQEGYEWVIITGTKQLAEHLKPILPIWEASTIVLPPGATVQAMNLTSGAQQTLGNLHIPSFLASTTLSPTYPYTDVTDVTGLYPQPHYGYHRATSGDHVEIQPFLFPVQHNPDTDETLLWTHATLQLTYTLTSPVAISSFGLSADRAKPGEALPVSALIHNAGASELVGLNATLVVSDVLGRWVSETDSGLFTIAAGGVYTLMLPVTAPLPDGPYHVEIRVWQASANLAHSHTFFTVSSGDILEIESPDPIWKTPGGTEVPLGLRYRSDLSTTEVATGTIRVLDAWGREVDRLNTIPLAVPPDSDRLLEAVWYFENLPTGWYMLSASVEIAGRIHGPVSRAVQVTTHEIWLPLVFKDRSP